MGRQVDVEDLVGPGEIASRCGVNPTTVNKWVERHTDFPRPLVHLAMGKVYSWTEINAWQSTRTRPGQQRPT